MTSGADKTTGFKDVAGLEEEKSELEEIVDFLRNPGRYTKVGCEDSQRGPACGTARNG